MNRKVDRKKQKGGKESKEKRRKKIKRERKKNPRTRFLPPLLLRQSAPRKEKDYFYAKFQEHYHKGSQRVKKENSRFGFCSLVSVFEVGLYNLYVSDPSET